jgi:hypothetical protein
MALLSRFVFVDTHSIRNPRMHFNFSRWNFIIRKMLII